MNKIRTYSGDFGLDYRNKIKLANENKLRYDFGIAITNFGPRVSYSSNPLVQKDFIPTALKIGTMWTYEKFLSKERQLNYSIAYQAEKLLVPTPQYYDSNGVLLGVDTNVPAFDAIFLSFYDAPNGFDEEIHEIIHKFGGEVKYKMNNTISYVLRAGYFYNHYTKGNRKFGTIGTGFKYKHYHINFAYIIDTFNSPLAHTTNINLGFHKILN